MVKELMHSLSVALLLILLGGEGRLYTNVESIKNTDEPVIHEKGEELSEPCSKEEYLNDWPCGGSDYIYMSHFKKCVKAYTSSTDWNDAEKKTCRPDGGNLVTITSLEFETKLDKLFFEGRGQAYWIGLNKELTSSFVWAGGGQSTYYNWRPGSDRNSRETNCVVTNLEILHSWDVVSCVMPHPFICERYSDEHLLETTDLKFRPSINLTTKWPGRGAVIVLECTSYIDNGGYILFEFPSASGYVVARSDDARVTVIEEGVYRYHKFRRRQVHSFTKRCQRRWKSELKLEFTDVTELAAIDLTIKCCSERTNGKNQCRSTGLIEASNTTEPVEPPEKATVKPHSAETSTTAKLPSRSDDADAVADGDDENDNDGGGAKNAADKDDDDDDDGGSGGGENEENLYIPKRPTLKTHLFRGALAGPGSKERRILVAKCSAFVGTNGVQSFGLILSGVNYIWRVSAAGDKIGSPPSLGDFEITLQTPTSDFDETKGPKVTSKLLFYLGDDELYSPIFVCFSFNVSDDFDLETLEKDEEKEALTTSELFVHSGASREPLQDANFLAYLPVFWLLMCVVIVVSISVRRVEYQRPVYYDYGDDYGDDYFVHHGPEAHGEEGAYFDHHSAAADFIHYNIGSSGTYDGTYDGYQPTEDTDTDTDTDNVGQLPDQFKIKEHDHHHYDVDGEESSSSSSSVHSHNEDEDEV